MCKFYKIILIISTMLIMQGCNNNEKISTQAKIKETEKISKVEETTINHKDKFINEIIQDMSIEEKIGQLFMVSIRQNSNNEPALIVDENISNTFTKYKPSGFILFQQNIDTAEQTQNFINDLQSNMNIPLFIGIDEEGGVVSRLQSSGKVGSTKFPVSEYVGNKNDSDLTYSLGSAIGKELYALGFNMNFAPVADINTNPNNPVIGNRSFSSDADIVAKMVVAEINGMQDQNVSSVIKHFPGHGDTKTDTHEGFTYVDSDLDRLEQIEFIPFKAGIDAGVDAIMISHIALPNVTGNNTPSSLSKDIINDILRQKLNYNGIVITDALDMKAITEQYDSGQVAVMAIEAGIDILLMPEDLDLAYKSLYDAVENNIITQQRIDESLERILSLKYDRDLFSDNMQDKSPLDILGCDEHRAIVNKFN